MHNAIDLNEQLRKWFSVQLETVNLGELVASNEILGDGMEERIKISRSL